jgi:uroporphyrinogen-III synthase
VPLSAAAQAALAGTQPVIVPLFSPRTALMFQKQAVICAPVVIAAMSKSVADACDRTAVQRVEIAAQPTAQFMRTSIQRLLDADRWVEGREDAQ